MKTSTTSLVTKTDLKNLEEKLLHAFKTLQGTVIEKMDAVMGKLKTMEEEFTLQMGKYESINDLEDQVEDHEKRLQKLEHPSL